jgi:hypothetical protein
MWEFIAATVSHSNGEQRQSIADELRSSLSAEIVLLSRQAPPPVASSAATRRGAAAVANVDFPPLPSSSSSQQPSSTPLPSLPPAIAFLSSVFTARPAKTAAK